MLERLKNGTTIKYVPIGYWHDPSRPDDGLPVAQDHVDTTWDSRERDLVVDYVLCADVLTQWRGVSACRFCGKFVGSKCLTDKVYQWPEGYVHYLQEHGVKPPQEFIDHIIKQTTEVP
jgi:hypothetical protein